MMNVILNLPVLTHTTVTHLMVQIRAGLEGLEVGHIVVGEEGHIEVKEIENIITLAMNIVEAEMAASIHTMRLNVKEIRMVLGGTGDIEVLAERHTIRGLGEIHIPLIIVKYMKMLINRKSAWQAKTTDLKNFLRVQKFKNMRKVS